MADEIARLGVAVDSTSAVNAINDVDRLAAAGDRATASAKKLAGSWQSMTLTPAQLYTTVKGVQQFRSEMSAARNAIAQTDQEWKKATFSNSQLMKANQSLVNFRNEARAAAQASAQLTQAQHAQAASHHQVAKAAVGYTKSAKEMAFATRNLPAQFTDIAVSLQAGQNPLTVLLQQGGQLKDMFGGIGPAARALGGYIRGLITPYTLAAAAIGSLAIAWVQGDNEARRMNATLELQGNSLGVTTNDLIRASEEMERFGVSQGKAVDALNAVAASGKIFGESIQTVAEAAITMEREAGQAIEKTVEDFASLSGDPVQAAIKLDEQYKFLTSTVYEQIKALEDQGDRMGAAQLAMDALAGTIDQRGKEIEGNLGTLEKTWRAVAGAAKWAWDQMLNIGREDSVQERLDDLNKKLAASKEALLRFEPGSDQHTFISKGLVHIKEQFEEITRESVAAAAKSRRERDTRIAAEESIALDQEVRRYATNAEKRELERTRIEAQALRAREAEERLRSEGWQKRVAEINRDEAKAIEQMEKRLADPKTPKPKKSQEARDAERLLRERAQQYEGLTRALDQHEDVLSAAGEAQERLTSFERYAVKTLSDLENGHTALDAAQQAEIRARIESLRVIDRQNQERERENRLLANGAALAQRIADEETRQAQQHGGELTGIGRGQNEAALEQALEDIRIRTMQERMDLEAEFQKERAVGSAEYMRQLDMINQAEQRMLNAEINQLERRRQAMGDWRNGARSAMEDIAWQMGDVAGRTRDSFMTAFGAMNTALNNFATTGKLKIKDFATVVIAELLRIALTIAASKILTSIFGATATGGAGSGSETAAYDSWFQANSAQGNVMQGGRMLSTFALGGVTGMVRNSPTLFPMAGGTMLMAEQEPEAIMPLGRGPDGKLGVRSHGGGTTTMNVSTVVNVNQQTGETSSSTTAEGDNSRDGKRLGEMIDSKIRQVLADERRQGGVLWAMQNGR